MSSRDFPADISSFSPIVKHKRSHVIYVASLFTEWFAFVGLPTCEVIDRDLNNTLGEADQNRPLCQSALVFGHLSSTDVSDYYRIELEQVGAIQIDLTNLSQGADYDLYLYNSNGERVALASTVGSQDERINIFMNSGGYYIRVFSLRYAGDNSYRLRWGFTG